MLVIQHVLCLTVFFLIGACSSYPDRSVSEIAASIPSHWVGINSGDQINNDWLTTFYDPVLTKLVNEALNNNLDLKVAAARVEEARERAIIAGAERWPQLGVSSGYLTETSGISNTNNTFLGSSYGAFNALFSLSWEIDLWGRIKALKTAAEKDADVVNADLYAAKLSLAARIAQMYYELIEANLQTQVAEQSIKDRRKIVDLVRGRFSRGLTRGLDLRLALTDLANAEAQLALSRNQVQLLSRQLDVLLGRYPAGVSEISIKSVANLPKLPKALSAGLPSQLLERRPDLIAAFLKLRAMDSRVESAKKALLPRFSLTGVGGTSSTALADMIDPRAVAWNLAAGLVQPLFTGGRLSSEIRLNEAQTQEALNNYKSTALNAFREVEQKLAAEQWLRAQENALLEAVEQTEASRKLAVSSYQQGLIEILTLLDSYRSTLNAQSAHLALQRQLLTNRIELYLALGGGI